MKPASVKLAPNSAFPYPGWNLGNLSLKPTALISIIGDIFAPDVNGAVLRIQQASQITKNWVKIPGGKYLFVKLLTNLVNEITLETVFDDTGSVYNGDLIITFKKSVYRINPKGNYSLIVASDLLDNYEGLVVVPNNPRYGAMAGTILAPQTGNKYYIVQGVTPSLATGAGRSIAIIYSNGTVKYLFK
jgi:hypothetical protein